MSDWVEKLDMLNVPDVVLPSVVMAPPRKGDPLRIFSLFGWRAPDLREFTKFISRIAKKSSTARP
jgi:hypothetical protein